MVQKGTGVFNMLSKITVSRPQRSPMTLIKQAIRSMFTFQCHQKTVLTTYHKHSVDDVENR